MSKVEPTNHQYEPLHVIGALAFFIAVAAFAMSAALWIYVLSR